ncbi:protein DOWNY MILDEW RESISTANCE 6-like [Pistacia vera]|uniref:protein DOWNY MILDEW RESISTANCE 6-like n=1 Tax=Pistacia vera TaxID=55513 RepID=UPI0012632170|nr:protein DOWNY MILDEW RESISTANCE 6-like [Pistacia vera]
MDRKNQNSGICYSNLPESYIKPESKGRRLSEVSECENIPTIDLGSGDSKLAQQIGDACKCFGFFQVIDHGMSLEEVEKTLKVARKFCRLPVEEKLKRYSAQKFVPDAQQILLPSGTSVFLWNLS